MSLKLCCALPACLNSLKSTRVLLLSSIYTKPSKRLVHSVNFGKNIQYRCLSAQTTCKKQDSPIKQVYYGSLTPQIRAIKLFSLSTSLVGIIAQPLLYKEIGITGNVPMIIAAYSFIGFFTFVTPVLLHFVTKKYVTHLSYNKKSGSYIAKTVNFFCMTKETQFKPEQVVVPDVPGLFTSFRVNGKAMFLDPRLFDQPEHYAKIMGYDKPIDFKLNTSPPESRKSTNNK